MTDFSAVREMTPYLSDPPAMAVGTPGKSGYLRLGFELDASGRSILRDWERRAPPPGPYSAPTALRRTRKSTPRRE